MCGVFRVHFMRVFGWFFRTVTSFLSFLLSLCECCAILNHFLPSGIFGTLHSISSFIFKLRWDPGHLLLSGYDTTDELARPRAPLQPPAIIAVSLLPIAFFHVFCNLCCHERSRRHTYHLSKVLCAVLPVTRLNKPLMSFRAVLLRTINASCAFLFVYDLMACFGEWTIP